MAAIKIIPCLDMKEGSVVKGVNFVNVRDAGDPVENARFYEAEGADELAMLDITATVEGRANRVEWAKDVAAALHHIPLTVGGGISTVEDIRELFAVGVSKVSINSAAVANPQFVADAVKEFGSERIIIAIDGQRNDAMPSGYEVIVSGGEKGAGIDVAEWTKQCEELGVSAILPTSLDGDGTKAGFDLGFTKAVRNATTLPVIASGGAGKLEDFLEVVREANVDALLAASVFHFREIAIGDLKDYLEANGVEVVR